MEQQETFGKNVYHTATCVMRNITETDTLKYLLDKNSTKYL